MLFVYLFVRTFKIWFEVLSNCKGDFTMFLCENSSNVGFLCMFFGRVMCADCGILTCRASGCTWKGFVQHIFQVG
jgi:hypothetical protein